MDSPWRRVRHLPDGPVSLVFIAVAVNGDVMGAAPMPVPMPVPMPWLWRAGRLCLAYTGLRVTVTSGGRLARGWICAVSPGSRSYCPIWDLALGVPDAPLRRGDFITIGEGIIEINPDPDVRPALAPAPDPA